MGAVKVSAYGSASRDEESVAVLVIDCLALKRVIRPLPVPVTARTRVDKTVRPRPLSALHCRCCTRLLRFFGRSRASMVVQTEAVGDLKEGRRTNFCLGAKRMRISQEDLIIFSPTYSFFQRVAKRGGEPGQAGAI